MKYIYASLLLGALLGSFYAPAAHAAPFCANGQGMSAECIYHDVIQCRKRSAQLGGLCTANSTELNITPGTGKYCLVYSNRVTACVYADRASCDNDAIKNGAVCIELPSGNIQPDPYKSDPNSKY